uniref:LmbE-like protein n=2 Tax=Burkholderiaceae TaxID=119060 RepID=Q46SZ0_CUPPJ
MPTSHAPERMTILSPHLDDAVFSCGCLIAAVRNPNVLTVFAGLPSPDMEPPEWDRAAGFGSAREAVLSRRHEDARALGQLGGHPLWLDLLDSQYRHPYTIEAVAERIRVCQILQESRTVIAPMGLFHSDHILTHAASLSLCRPALAMAGDHDSDDTGAEPQQWLFYEDAIYRRLPGLVQSQLAAWRQEGLIATPVYFATAPFLPRKMEAVKAYVSQLPLFSASQIADIGAPERYWSLAFAGRSQT